MKSDISSEIGTHIFTRAGLGAAPFKFLGMQEKRHPNGDGTSKPGASCDYCGTGIAYCFFILSACGKRSKVGCDCIHKADDQGLIKAYKSSPEFRKMERDKRRAKAKGDREIVAELIATRAGELSALPHPKGFTDRATGLPLSLLEWAQWMAANCGATGMSGTRKALQRALGA